MGYTDRREVRQFQYTAWPDHGVPDYPGRFFFILTYIFAFHKKKFKYQKFNIFLSSLIRSIPSILKKN